jgi:hypothetical protein
MAKSALVPSLLSWSTRAGSGVIGRLNRCFSHHPLVADVNRGCVTPKVISNVNELIQGDLEMLDGYEDLPAAEQERVERALKQGHVDDEDWKGVCDPNRFG